MRYILQLFFCFFVQFISAQLTFVESATSLGVGEGYGVSNLGGGVSFYDFDGDGFDDITYATEEGRETLFFKNNGGNFDRVDLGINDTLETKQVIWVDYDNDGDKDFFATSITGLNKLYSNNGDLTFTDVSDSSSLFTQNLYSYGASFGDIDNDGDLDVFISNRDVITKNQRNYLYENDQGIFKDITQSAGLFLENELSFCAAFFDYDNDGYQDIYVSSDKYTKMNRLYRNMGDLTFEDVSVASGAGISVDAMSTTIGDYNDDGWFDIYVTNTTGGNYHLRNNGDGTFTDVAQQLGTKFNSIAWGAVFLDADLDADLDLYVSGMLDGLTRLPSAFYENRAGNYEIPSDIGFENDTRTSFANAIGDINNDGLPDIVVMNDSENNFLWKNNTSNSNKWLKLKLEGVESNIDGIGSKIEVHANGKSRYRYTLCGEGYLGQNSGYEFFGLKTTLIIDYVKVTWPSGTVDIFADLSVNQALTLVEGSGTLDEVPETSQPVEPESEEPVQEEPPTNTDNLAEVGPSEFECTENDMILFPNPSDNGNYAICTDFKDNRYSVSVFDLYGRKVAARTISAKEPNFNLSNLGTGVYVVRISGNGNVFLKKILKR
jgi:hypothetical protein